MYGNDVNEVFCLSMSGRVSIPVIIDNGSGLCKAGLAGEEDPSVVFSATVGRTRYQVCCGLYMSIWYSNRARYNILQVIDIFEGKTGNIK